MSIIQTCRLTIRRFKVTDAEAFYAYMAKPSVNCFASEKLFSLAASELDVIKRGRDNLQFAVCLQERDYLIGNIFATQEDSDTFSLGWNFNASYHGNGYATESVQAFISFLFTNHKARRIFFYVEETNLPSQKLCERLGLRKEGLFREFISFVKNEDGTPFYENTIQFALLKKEWEALNRITDLK